MFYAWLFNWKRLTLHVLTCWKSISQEVHHATLLNTTCYIFQYCCYITVVICYTDKQIGGEKSITWVKILGIPKKFLNLGKFSGKYTILTIQEMRKYHIGKSKGSLDMTPYKKDKSKAIETVKIWIRVCLEKKYNVILGGNLFLKYWLLNHLQVIRRKYRDWKIQGHGKICTNEEVISWSTDSSLHVCFHIRVTWENSGGVLQAINHIICWKLQKNLTAGDRFHTNLSTMVELSSMYKQVHK